MQTSSMTPVFTMTTALGNNALKKTNLNSYIQDEIHKILGLEKVSQEILEGFANFVISNHRRKDPKPVKAKPLRVAEIKAAVFNYFGVGEKRTASILRKSARFTMETEGMNLPSLNSTEGWKTLYREFVGYLPGEEHQEGYGCINGVNIFQYFKPWRVFGLDPSKANPKETKQAYYALSKIYHPDNKATGDALIFDRINNMYASISAEA